MFGKNQFIASQHYDPMPFEAQVAAVGELIREGKASLQRALSTCAQNARRIELSNMLGEHGRHIMCTLPPVLDTVPPPAPFNSAAVFHPACSALCITAGAALGTVQRDNLWRVQDVRGRGKAGSAATHQHSGRP